MKHIFLFTVAYCCNLFTQSIEIRPATVHDLPAVFALDERVTYEFFKPLYTSIYRHLHIDRDVDADLQAELAADAENFPKLINNNENERLHIAWDKEHNIPCGLLVFSRDDNNELLLDLLLVDKQYRGKGIGRKLVQSIFQAFKASNIVHVYPVQHENDDTLKFYASVGFKNLGLATEDKVNSHGIRYSDIYYHFRLDIQK